VERHVIHPLSVMGPPVNEDPLVVSAFSSVWSSLFGRGGPASGVEVQHPVAQRGTNDLDAGEDRRMLAWVDEREKGFRSW